MPLARFIYLILLCALGSHPLLADENKEKKDPRILFDSESESAVFAKVKGTWKAFEFEGKQMIRLSPEPIQQSRVDLGSALASYDISVSAKVLGRNKKRLSPRMGVGLFGEYGYSLRISPNRNKIELVQYGEVIAESSFVWDQSVWHYIELTMRAQKTHWELTGKVWVSRESKPKKAQLVHKSYPSSLTHQLSGRAFLTGSPFNGLPIFYDEVVVRKK